MGRRRFDRSRSPPSQPRFYPRNRRSRSPCPRFSDFRSSRDTKSTSYRDSFSRRQIITWSRRYYGRDDDHEYPQCSRPRFGYEPRDYDREPAPSNFYNYSRIDDDDYDDYRRSRRPPSPRRPRYSSGSSDLKYGKNPSHGGSRHCDRESSPHRYRHPDSSCDYNNERPRRWWNDRNEQRWRRRQRKSISPPRFNYHERPPPPLNSYNYSSHRQYYYDDHEEHYPRSNNRPPSPPRHGHGCGFPPPGPGHNQNQNHGTAAANYHPSSSGDGFVIPDQTNIDNNIAIPCIIPEAVSSPSYSPDAPGSCTPIMESTPEKAPDRTPSGSPPIEQFQWGWLQ